MSVKHSRPLLSREEIERRRQVALALAEQYGRILKEQFAARRVIPFGSLVSDSLWHAGSDLDLAVEGLSPAALWQAEKALSQLSPPWLEVDLVPLEHVYPEVRARILDAMAGEKAMSENKYLGLKTRLTDQLLGLERIVQGIQTALLRAGTEPDEFATRALASYIDDFYKGCEQICERVAVVLDGSLPQGERWHQVLLGQMGEAGPSGRPPLFNALLLLELDEYRRFRHRVRHIYGYELETERVLTLAHGVEPLYTRVRDAVQRFSEWLDTQSP